MGVSGTQQDLFFFGNPSYVTKTLQFTQFGFALMAGTLLIFWDFVGVDNYTSDKYDDLQTLMIKSRWAKFYFIIIAYFLFYQNAKNMIPRFTLCTNMGHLINKKQLNATLLMYKFDQEHREREIKSKHNEEVEKMDQMFVKAEEAKETNIPKDKKSTQKKRLSQLEQISNFVNLPVESLPEAETQESVRSGSRRHPLVRSISESAAFFAPFPASTQTFRNTFLPDDSSMSSNSKANRKILKSATTDEIPLKKETRPRYQRKKSLSAPLHNNRSTLFMMDDNKMDQKSVSSKPSLPTVHEKHHNSPPLNSPPTLSKPLGSSKLMNKKSTASTKSSTNTETDRNEGSDTEDIPDAQIDHKDEAIGFSIADFVRRLYKNPTYNMFDTVFGTLFCILLIGMRIEILLVDSCIIKESTNSAEFSIHSAFWIEFSLYIYFIVSSAFFIAAHISENDHRRRSISIISEGSDIALSILCLSLLVLSEHFRCTSEKEVCGDFGSRSGLGVIEPFTVLIFFRLFRQRLGRRLLKEPTLGAPLKRGLSKSDHVHETINIDAVGAHQSHHHKSHSERLIQEVWASVIYEHSDLAETHGIFSAEILQVMLGLKVLTKKNVTSPVTMQNEIDAIIPRRMMNFESMAGEPLQNGFNEQFKLPSINIRGRDSFVSNYDSDEDSLPSLDGVNAKQMAQTKSKRNGNPTSPIKFYSRYSRLIRSMRRCIMKMPPLLNQWKEVDVVLTQHEIYFFDVENEIYAGDQGIFSNEKMKLIWDEMIARNGGKGLLLSDVAEGRTIAGHTLISRIKSIKVRLCNATDESMIKHQSSPQKDINELNEYWEVTDPAPRPTASSLEERFNSAGVNMLKIQLKLGQTMLFRFHCDLAMAEKSLTAYMEKTVKKSDLKRMMPLLWCHTLVRLCGSDKLDQELPHFGYDDDEEVNDYVEEEGLNQYVQQKRNRIFKSITTALVETEIDESIL